MSGDCFAEFFQLMIWLNNRTIARIEKDKLAVIERVFSMGYLLIAWLKSMAVCY
jgi:hypothetical protein